MYTHAHIYIYIERERKIKDFISVSYLQRSVAVK